MIPLVSQLLTNIPKRVTSHIISHNKTIQLTYVRVHAASLVLCCIDGEKVVGSDDNSVLISFSS